MSSPTPGETSTPSSEFKSTLDSALIEYKKTTGRELLEHPLAAEVKRCDSVDAISAILRGQARDFRRFNDSDKKLMRGISSIVGVLWTFSGTLDGVSSMALPPAGAIFIGIGVLLAEAKDVNRSHNALIELFERIENVLKPLSDYTQISSNTEVTELFLKTAAEVLSILSIATKEVVRKRAKIYFGKLLGRKDIEDAFKRLDGLIQEQIRMVIDQNLKATIENKDEINQASEKIDNISWDQIEQEVRRWFSPPDPSANLNTACEAYNNVPPTWFFEAGVFEDWMANGSLLWVHGKPGSGKTILCSAIIQHFMKLRHAGQATLAYFYFDFRDEEKQNVHNVLTSLLVQLSAYSKPCCDIIYRLYSAHGNGTQQPSNAILINRLKEMLAVAPQYPIFVVMDALDECPDLGTPSPRKAVLNLVMDLVHLHLQVQNLRICITSRSEVDIQTKLKPLAVNAISLDNESRQRLVISDYVSSAVSSDEQMKLWRDEDKELVIDELSERADGILQLASCQLETLRHAVQSDIRRILEDLPKTLEEIYSRVLNNIDENNRKPARLLLHCLAVSVRPLRVEELTEILTFDFDAAEGTMPKFHSDSRPNNQDAILSILSSLIAIADKRGSRVVQLSHLSVKEFLTSNRLASLTEHLTSFHVLPGPAHTTLTQACLGVLHSNYDRRVMDSPLAEYAARHWVTHAQFEDVASHVMGGLESLFDPDKAHFASWIGIYDIDAESGGRLPSEIPSPLYYAALCGFHDLVRHVAMKHPQHVNAIGGSYGFPLVAALSQNHFPVAELLLELGGRVDVRDTRKQTALHRIIDRHDKVVNDAVQFLLEHGADVNVKRDDLCTPLHLALNAGELKVVRMLLDHQADVNARNYDGKSPLHLLSKWEAPQNEDDGSNLVKLLLKRGGNVNEMDKYNATPLHLASLYRRLEIVRVLLDHGANTDMKNNQGEIPFQIAIRRNDNSQHNGVGVARLLLQHGAAAYARDKYPLSALGLVCCFGKDNIFTELLLGDEDLDEDSTFNPETSRGHTFRLWIEECDIKDRYDTLLLHSASFRGSSEMVEMLLNHGTKVDARNYWSETALHVASRRTHDPQRAVRIARLLVDHGADVNARCMDHWTALHSACYFRKVEIIQILLDHGAEANAEDESGVKPLHLVSNGKYESKEDGVCITRLLAEHGADVNAKRKDHWTPLHRASYYGKLEIVRLLLDHGADANAEERSGERPLHKVSYGKYDSKEDGVCAARLLAERGADVNTKRKDHCTPLHLASYSGKLEIVRLLLDHGAEVNADGDGERPLHKVSYGAYDSKEDGVCVARLLVERGGDINTKRKDHCTPLHLASYFGKLGIVRLLLDHGADANAELESGEKPLHKVSYGKYDSKEDGIRVARLLVERGADVNAKRRKDHWTPLHYASYYGELEIMQLLLDHGADANVEGESGERPLHKVSYGEYECKEDDVRVARLLAEHGADVDAKRKDHMTPLHLASYFGKLEIVRLLLDHGADANAETNSGERPLHKVSCIKSEFKKAGVHIAQLLLERGAVVNARRRDHLTPLHHASYYGKLDIVRLLLDHGAKVDAVSVIGETTLHLLSQGKYESEEDGVCVARLLLDFGADVNAEAKSGVTALNLANRHERTKLAGLLLVKATNVNALSPRAKSGQANRFKWKFL